MRRILAPAGGALCFALLVMAGAPGAQAERLSLQTRPNVALNVDLRAPEKAAALVLLFEGGGGRVDADSKGFAHLAHQRFAGKGIASALIDAPSDQRGFMGGMHPKFRTSNEHVADIDKIVAALRAETGLPVWVLGISLGTRSAAWYASERPEAIDGVVLLSSSMNSARGKPVDSFRLQRVSVPLLAIAHEKDACSGTPPSGARRIVAAATASRAAEVRLFSRGRNAGRRPCGVRTYHTFYGIEDEVLAAIADFIRDHTP